MKNTLQPALQFVFLAIGRLNPLLCFNEHALQILSTLISNYIAIFSIYFDYHTVEVKSFASRWSVVRYREVTFRHVQLSELAFPIDTLNHAVGEREKSKFYYREKNREKSVADWLHLGNCLLFREHEKERRILLLEWLIVLREIFSLLLAETWRETSKLFPSGKPVGIHTEGVINRFKERMLDIPCDM